MTGSSDELNAEKVKAAIQKKRIDSGVLPAQKDAKAEGEKTEKGACEEQKMFDSDELDPEKVKEMLRQTRACALKNAESSQTLKDAQAATPGRGVPTGKFRVRGSSANSGAIRLPTPENAKAPAKKEKKSP